jgi:hypothetical protein
MLDYPIAPPNAYSFDKLSHATKEKHSLLTNFQSIKHYIGSRYLSNIDPVYKHIRGDLLISSKILLNHLIVYFILPWPKERISL